MSHIAITELLKGHVSADSKVTVKGWIRTRRDSKAGISFLAVHDGSCFDPIQAVVPNTLNNYEDVTKLTAGCSVSVTGTLVESQGKGQSFEIQADSVEVLGWVENPDTYPMAAKRHSIEYLREHAHLASSYERYWCSNTRTKLFSASYSPLLSRAGLLLD